MKSHGRIARDPHAGSAPAAFETARPACACESQDTSASQVTGRSGDGRMTAAESRGSNFHELFQCKRYKGSVSAGDISVAALVGRDGVSLFRRGTFTRRRQRSHAGRCHPINPVDGGELAGGTWAWCSKGVVEVRRSMSNGLKVSDSPLPGRDLSCRLNAVGKRCVLVTTRGASSQPVHAGRSVSAPDRLGRLVRARLQDIEWVMRHTPVRGTARPGVASGRLRGGSATSASQRWTAGSAAGTRETRERVVPGTPGRRGGETACHLVPHSGDRAAIATTPPRWRGSPAPGAARGGGAGRRGVGGARYAGLHGARVCGPGAGGVMAGRGRGREPRGPAVAPGA